MSEKELPEIYSDHEKFLKGLTEFVTKADLLRHKIDDTVNKLNSTITKLNEIGTTVSKGLGEGFKTANFAPVTDYFNKLSNTLRGTIKATSAQTVLAINKMGNDIATAMGTAMAKGGTSKSSKTKSNTSTDLNKQAQEISSIISRTNAANNAGNRERLAMGLRLEAADKKYEKDQMASIQNRANIDNRTFDRKINRLRDEANMENKIYDLEMKNIRLWNKFEKMIYDQKIASIQEEANLGNRVIDRKMKKIRNQANQDNRVYDREFGRLRDEATRINSNIPKKQTVEKYEDLYRELNGRNPASLPMYEKVMKNGMLDLKKEIKLRDEANAMNDSYNKQKEAADEAQNIGRNPLTKTDLAMSVVGLPLDLENPDKIASVLRWISGQVGSVLGNMGAMISTAFTNAWTIVKGLTGLVIAGGAAFVGMTVQVKNWASDIVLTTEKVRGFNIALLGMMKTQGGVKEYMKMANEVAQDFPLGFEQTYNIAKSMSLIQPLRPMLQDAKTAKSTMDSVMSVAMALNAMEPEQGIQGAMFTLKEALAGDMMSLKRRFEIPVNLITTLDGKKLTDLKSNPGKMLEGLKGYLTNIYDKDAMKSLSRQFGNILGQIESTYFQFKSKIGEAGFYDAIIDDLVFLKDKLKTFMAGTEIDGFAKRISNALYSGYKALKSFTLGMIKTIADLFGVKLTDQVESYASALTKFIEGFVMIFIKITNTLNSKKDAIVAWIRFIYTEVKKFIDGVISNAKRLVPAVEEAFSYLQDKFKEFQKFTGISNQGMMKGAFIFWLFGPGNWLSLVASSLNSAAMLFTTTLGPAIAASVKEVGFLKTALSGVFAVLPVALFSVEVYSLWDTFGNFKDWCVGAGSPWDWLMGTNANQKYDKFKDDIAKLNGLMTGMGLKGGLTSENITGKAGEQRKIELETRTRQIRSELDAQKQTETTFKSPKYGGFFEFEFVGQAIEKIMGVMDGRTMKLMAENSQLIEAQHLLDTLRTTMSEVAIPLAKDANSWVGKTDSAQQNVAAIVDTGLSLFRIKIVDNALKKYSKPEVSFEGVSQAQKISMMSFVESLRKDFGIKNAQGYSISDVTRTAENPLYHKDGMGDHDLSDNHKPNAFDIPGTALENIKKASYPKQQEFIDRIFEFADTAGQFIAFEGTVMDDFMAQIQVANTKFPGVKIDQEGLKSGTGAIHIRMMEDVNKKVGEVAKAAGDKGLFAAKDVLNLELKLIENINPPAPPDAMAELKKITESAYNDFRSAMNKNAAAYKDNLFPGELGKIVDEMNQQGVLIGSALTDNIKSNFDNNLKQMDAAITKAQLQAKRQSPADFNQYQEDQILLSDSIAAKARMEKQGNFDLASAPTLSKNALKMQLAKSKFDYTGYNVSDKIGEQNVMVGELAKIKMLSGEIDVDNFNELASVLSEIQYKMRQGLGFEDASAKVKEFGLMMFNATHQVKYMQYALKQYDEAQTTSENVDAFGLPTTASAGSLNATDIFGSMGGSAINSTVAFVKRNLQIFKIKYDYYEEVRKNTEKTNLLLDQLKSVFDETTKKEDYIEYKLMNESRTKYTSALAMAPSIKRVEELRAAASKLGIMNRSTNISTIDTEIGLVNSGQDSKGFLKSLKLGMDKSISEWKSFSSQFIDIGIQMVNDVTGTLETGFFDLFTNKLNGLTGLFRQVGNSVKDMVLKIISKMLALQTMKFVLGVEIGANGMPSMSGGGLMGMLSGAGGGGGGGILGSIGSLLGGGKQSRLSDREAGISGIGMDIGTGTAMGLSGIPGLASLGSSAMGLKSLTGMASKSGGALGSIGKFMASGTGMALLGAGMFLTQPGRLFGGTVDHTGPAKEAQTANAQTVEELRTRRISDAQKYMYSGVMGGIANFNLKDSVYSESTSGGGLMGLLTGKKKTTSAGVDPTAMISSQTEYFKNLMNASVMHYSNLHKIDKMREVSEYAAIEEELKYKKTYLSIVQEKYNTAANAASPDLKKMDELRGTLETAAEEVYQAIQASMKAQLEEGFKKQEYGAFTKFGLGVNDMAYEKEMLGIQKQRLDSMAGTSAWYDANMSYLQSAKSMADKLRDMAESYEKNVISTKVGLIKSNTYVAGGTLNKYSTEIAANDKLIYDAQYNGKDLRNQIGTERVAKRHFLATTYSNEPKYQFKSNEEAIRYYQKENEKKQTALFGANVKGETQYRKDNMFADSSKMNLDELSRRSDTMNAIKGVEGADAEYFQALKEFSDQQFTVADDMKSMMSSGLISRASTDIVALMNGSVEDFKNVFLNVQKQFREKSFTQSILDTTKAFTDSSTYSSIVSQISGMSNLKDQDKMVALLQGTGAANGADPYTAWYNYAMQTVTQKIANAESGGDEMFGAYNDLFSLLSENADHLKAKADEVNKKMEASLDDIADTLKVRLAEERKSLKGDVYFMDTSKYDVDPATILKLKDMIKNNDPNASLLLDEIKRKVNGVSR